MLSALPAPGRFYSIIGYARNLRPTETDPVPAPQAVVGDPEQGVGVRRQIDPNNVGLFVDDVVDKSRVLTHIAGDQAHLASRRRAMPAGQDHLGIVACRFSPGGEVIGIDPDVVAADEAWRERQEIPFGAGRV